MQHPVQIRPSRFVLSCDMKFLLGGVANLEIDYPRCEMSSAVRMRCGSRLGSATANVLLTPRRISPRVHPDSTEKRRVQS
jgi:hypothetical protein